MNTTITDIRKVKQNNALTINYMKQESNLNSFLSNQNISIILYKQVIDFI